jgi:hypothetical protein
MMKKSLKITALLIAVAALGACTQLDVIGDDSIATFDSLLTAIPESISADSEEAGWRMVSPDGDAVFVWSNDFSKTEMDLKIEINSTPFIESGLDPDLLPEGMIIGDKIIVGTDLGSDVLEYEKEANPLESYKKIVELYRGSIGYHDAFDHYGIDLMEGNMLEWAKDMTNNDKDLVFVLNPEPFINAGVDPSTIDGWVYAEIPSMDKDGKPIEVFKLLKIFDVE